MKRLFIAILATISAILPISTSAHADDVRFNTYPKDDSRLIVLGSRAKKYSGGEAGITRQSSNPVVEIQFVAPKNMLLDKIFLQMSNMNRPGRFSGELLVNGVSQGSGPRCTVVDPVAPNPTLTDVEWDLRPNVALEKGQKVTIQFRQLANTPDKATAASVHAVAASESSAVLIDVNKAKNRFTPLALLPAAGP